MTTVVPSGLFQAGALARNGLRALAAAAGYYACAYIGTALSVPPSGFAILWPATAFLISILLVEPPRRWWLYAAVIVPAHFHLAAILQPHAPFVVVLTQIGGNLALAASTAVAVNATMLKPRDFGSFRSVLVFILVAGIAVPAIVNALILSVHLATGWADNFWQSWQQWMIAGIFPTITIPPLAVLALNGGLTGRPPASSRSPIELGLLAALLFALSFLAFGGAMNAASWPALFLTPFPLLLWAAVRLGVGGSCVALLALAAAVIAQALLHQGPFAAHSSIDDVLSLQAFLVTLSIPQLLLAALLDERRRTAELLRQSEARIQVTAASTDTGLWQWDEAAHRLWSTENCQAMLGLSLAATATPLAFLDAVHPEDRPHTRDAIETALLPGAAPSTVEFRLCDDGETRWFSLSTHTEVGSTGAPIRVDGVFRDVTDRVGAQMEADRLRGQLEHLQDEERRRIAEELHDSTGQHLAAANLNLSSLRARVSGKAQDIIDEIMQSVREATTEIRTFSYLLHPPELSQEGLRTVLEQYVPGFGRRTGLITSLRIHPVADSLPASHQHALLRITQESLGNVHRHAQATRASVNLRCVSGNVHLLVHDDGHGIRAEAGQRPGERLRLGVGIPAMTARARLLGGRMDINSRSGGTTVHVAIPLPAETMKRAPRIARRRALGRGGSGLEGA